MLNVTRLAPCGILLAWSLGSQAQEPVTPPAMTPPPAATPAAPQVSAPVAPPAPAPAGVSGIGATLDQKEAELDQRLEEMQQRLDGIRKARDPQERWRLMREQSQSWRQAMQMARPVPPQGTRSGRMPWSGSALGPQGRWSRQPPMGGVQPGWGQRPSMGGPMRQRGYPRPPAAPEGPAGSNALAAEEQQLQRRMEMLQQRLDQQQKILEEILRYRQPIEQMLQEKGVQLPQNL